MGKNISVADINAANIYINRFGFIADNVIDSQVVDNHLFVLIGNDEYNSKYCKRFAIVEIVKGFLIKSFSYPNIVDYVSENGFEIISDVVPKYIFTDINKAKKVFNDIPSNMT